MAISRLFLQKMKSLTGRRVPGRSNRPSLKGHGRTDGNNHWLRLSRSLRDWSGVPRKSLRERLALSSGRGNPKKWDRINRMNKTRGNLVNHVNRVVNFHYGMPWGAKWARISSLRLRERFQEYRKTYREMRPLWRFLEGRSGLTLLA